MKNGGAQLPGAQLSIAQIAQCPVVRCPVAHCPVFGAKLSGDQLSGYRYHNTAFRRILIPPFTLPSFAFQTNIAKYSKIFQNHAFRFQKQENSTWHPTSHRYHGPINFCKARRLDVGKLEIAKAEFATKVKTGIIYFGASTAAVHQAARV